MPLTVLPPPPPFLPPGSCTRVLCVFGQWQAPQAVDVSGLFTNLTKARTALSERNVLADEEGLKGLGRLPPYFPSVSSIMLFNSAENPYKTYSSFNNLMGVGGKDRETVRTAFWRYPLNGILEIPFESLDFFPLSISRS